VIRKFDGEHLGSSGRTLFLRIKSKIIESEFRSFLCDECMNGCLHIFFGKEERFWNVCDE
jgi:hypothetical protein